MPSFLYTYRGGLVDYLYDKPSDRYEHQTVKLATFHSRAQCERSHLPKLLILFALLRRGGGIGLRAYWYSYDG